MKKSVSGPFVYITWLVSNAASCIVSGVNLMPINHKMALTETKMLMTQLRVVIRPPLVELQKYQLQFLRLDVEVHG